MKGAADDTRFRAGLSGTSATFLAEGPVGTARGIVAGAAARRSYLDYLVKRLDGEAFAFGFGDAQTKIAYDITPRHQLQWLAVAGRSQFEEPPENLGANDVARAMSESWLSGLTWRYARSPRLVATQRIYATGVDFRNTSAAGGALDTGRAAELGWRADASIAASSRWMFELGGDATRVSGSHERRRRFEGAASESVVQPIRRAQPRGVGLRIGPVRPGVGVQHHAGRAHRLLGADRHGRVVSLGEHRDRRRPADADSRGRWHLPPVS